MTNNTIPNVPRYRVEKTGRGFWPYCVRAGDGTREVFVGHQKQCAVVAAELETAFEDGKFVSCIAPSPAGVYSADPLACPGCASGCFRCASSGGVDGLEVVGYVSQDDIKWKGDCTLRLKPYSDYVIPLCRLSDATAIIDGLRGEVERSQMQLAACGVVALANTIDSAGEARQMHPDYMSASCSDVADAVDREIALRTERDQHARRIGELEGVIGEMVAMIDCGDEPGSGSEWHKSASAILSAGKENAQ